MSKQRSKAELLTDIQTERRRLDALLNTFSESDLIRKGVVGDWSVKDVIVHLTAWERLLMDWYKAGLTGDFAGLPDPVGMSRKSIDVINQDIFDRNKDTPLDSAVNDYRKHYQRVLSTLETITDEKMFTPGFFPWTGKLTLADYISGNTCNHYAWAKTKIRAWVKTQV